MIWVSSLDLRELRECPLELIFDELSLFKIAELIFYFRWRADPVVVIVLVDGEL